MAALASASPQLDSVHRAELSGPTPLLESHWLSALGSAGPYPAVGSFAPEMLVGGFLLRPTTNSITQISAHHSGEGVLPDDECVLPEGERACRRANRRSGPVTGSHQSLLPPVPYPPSPIPCRKGSDRPRCPLAPKTAFP